MHDRSVSSSDRPIPSSCHSKPLLYLADLYLSDRQFTEADSMSVHMVMAGL
ncbi:hypothetical protein IQ268_24210 [Oculatella sp. LEGE 06141]|uniref:hypothetical protein n=1 Tax=Oculatella sp. LEGE 06141 TaxID=1828648 RepID=UPI0018802993|nr:hypothetical protein [Oculatella sp. LEGE 06141]MBE9181673.1 hypothetical protein [Oculatella sp. LEGE 06141]